MSTITRRSALRTAGTARARPAPTPTPVVGPVSNVPDLAADFERYTDRATAAYGAAEAAEEALKARLDAEQRSLFEAVIEAYQDRQWDAERSSIAGLALHLPGLAGALWATYEHVIAEGSARCCLPEIADYD